MLKQTKHGPINNLPECLYLDVVVEPPRVGRVARAKRSDTLVLKVTAHFNEQTIEHPFGTVLVGLCGGDLRLTLDGMELSEHRKLARFQESKTKKATETASRRGTVTRKSGTKSSATAEVTGTGGRAGGSLARESERSLTEEATAQGTAEYVSEEFQLHALGPPRPGWRFRKKGPEEFLEGSFQGEEFGTCLLLRPNGRLEARFEVEGRFVRLRVLSGLLLSKGVYSLENPAKAKLKLANFLLWKRVIQPLLQPCLSHVEIAHG